MNRSVREELADVPAILLASDEHTSMGILDKCRKEIHSRYHAQSIPLCLYVGAPYPLPLTKQSADSIYVQYKNNQLNLYGMGDSLFTLQHRDYVFTPLPCDVRFFLQCCLVFTILSAIGLQFHARSYTWTGFRCRYDGLVSSSSIHNATDRGNRLICGHSK